MKKKFDFSGYATKNNLKCSDGRVINQDAFKHQDGTEVPLVWAHNHSEPGNVLGKAILENRKDGVYAYCSLNNTESGKNARELVRHGDITAMSILANDLVQKGKSVLHGAIREVSLVLSGANPGALIDNLAFAHSYGDEVVLDETEAIIYTDEVLTHGEDLKSDDQDDSLEHADKDKTVQEVFDSFTEEQKTVVYGMIAHALDSEVEDDTTDDEEDGDEAEHSNNGGKEMKHNVFDKDGKETKTVLTHDQFKTILDTAAKCGSFREAVLTHAGTYGIDNIEILFPDARNVTTTPEMISRDMEWVSGFLGGVHKSPFSRIKSTSADITADEARAKGYLKGGKKIEEVFPVAKRTTEPTTVYKKQKLDRDDIIDITDFDVVVWIKQEMRVMLNEEIARAALIGDGRAIDNPDKINETKVRPVYKDDAFYSVKKTLVATAKPSDIVDEVVRSRKDYKGTGTPNFYTTADVVTDLLLQKDTQGRRLYNTMAELEAAMRVAKIIEVEVMEGIKRNDGTNDLDLVGILLNPRDYTFGADKGGEINMFDDFDIDYNQYKYLLETRLSGALTKYQSAVVLEKIHDDSVSG